MRHLVLSATVSVLACSQPAPIPRQIELEPEFEIGALEGPEEVIFGEIRSVKFDQDGGLFVLDGLTNNVRWFDSTGAFLSEFGRRGQGPGEFEAAMDLAQLSDGRTIVHDPLTQRLTVLRPTGSDLILDDVWRWQMPGEQICVDGHDVVGLGPIEEKKLHRYRITEDSIRWFNSAVPLERQGLASDHETLGANLACGGEVPFVVVAPSVYLQVQFFTREGVLLGSAEFDEHEALQMSRTETGGVRLRPREGGPGFFYRIASVLPFQEGALVSLHQGGEAPVNSMRELWYVDPSGHKERVGQLDFTLHDRWKNRVVGIRQVPYPHVVVSRLVDR